MDTRQTIIVLALAGGVGYALYRARKATPALAAPPPAPTYVAQPYMTQTGSPAARGAAPKPTTTPASEGASAAAEWFGRTPVRDLAATTTFFRNLMWAAVSRHHRPASYFLDSAAAQLTRMGASTLVVMGARTAATLAGPLAAAAGAAG